jgi:Acyclic terpene utilisation family protein AtuA
MDRQVKPRGAREVVRIGGASGFWGDSSLGPVQLVRHGGIDYLVFDYLAEVTMSLLARARMKDADAGFAVDFVSVAMKGVLSDIAARRVKVIANAGGVNSRGCRRTLEALCAQAGVALTIAVVEGDDVLPLLEQGRLDGARELCSGEPVPAKLLTANAYLGALPIAAALKAGADVVITGRCVDSALTLGVLMHEFGWRADDYDRVAAGSLAGHIVECGPRPAHRLGARAGLGRHRLSDRGVPRRRHVRRHQADRHRRPRHAGDGRRAGAVRGRRSGGLPVARRDRGLLARASGRRRGRPRPRDGRTRLSAHRTVQGVGDLG